MREKIFAPLGMNSSGYVEEISDWSNTADAYKWDEDSQTYFKIDRSVAKYIYCSVFIVN